MNYMQGHAMACPLAVIGSQRRRLYFYLSRIQLFYNFIEMVIQYGQSPSRMLMK
jgi:hypothetical protein